MRARGLQATPRLGLRLLPFLLATTVVGDPQPISLAFDKTTTFGPDGPWQAVQVSVGTGAGATNVHLYPGGSYDSTILTTKMCNDTTSCPAAAAGLYNPSSSPTSDWQDFEVPGSLSSWMSDKIMNMSGQASYTIDTMQLSANNRNYVLPQSIWSSAISIQQALANGSTYAPRVGSLALGAPQAVQSFAVTNGTNVTGNLLTGQLRSQGNIPSSSFGLHVGSVPLGQAGSLVLGGYDKSRLVGDVAMADLVDLDEEPVLDLIDLHFSVEAGGTPFNQTTVPSFILAPGSTNPFFAVTLNPLVPYMFLPSGMCEAMAKYLPVTWLPGSGLYAWNTHDFRYQMIMSSSASLAFTFAHGETNLTIKVPFQLLNLTLESPLVATPTPYFPCKSSQGQQGRWYLGRAFLQAAYLGINWETKKFFVGQAPGPTSGSSEIVPIQPSDTTIASSPASGFASSWQGRWTILPANSTDGAASTSGGASSGLSTGAKAGIGVVGALVVLSVIGLAVFFWLQHRRRRRRREIEQEDSNTLNEAHGRSDMGSLSTEATLARPAMYGYDDKGHKEWGEDRSSLDSPGPYSPFGGFKSDYSASSQRHELPVLPIEMEAPNHVHEADARSYVHEAPTDAAHEMEGSRFASRDRRPRPISKDGTGSPRTYSSYSRRPPARWPHAAGRSNVDSTLSSEPPTPPGKCTSDRSSQSSSNTLPIMPTPITPKFSHTRQPLRNSGSASSRRHRPGPEPGSASASPSTTDPRSPLSPISPLDRGLSLRF